jgi:hypothetical protein
LICSVSTRQQTWSQVKVFSDVILFYLNGHEDTQIGNPHFTHEVPFHVVKVVIWCTLSTRELLIQCFMQKLNHKCTNSLSPTCVAIFSYIQFCNCDSCPVHQIWIPVNFVCSIKIKILWKAKILWCGKSAVEQLLAFSKIEFKTCVHSWQEQYKKCLCSWETCFVEY